jgi:hypothetical protein
MAGALVLLAAWVAGSPAARAQNGTMEMDEYIRTVCADNPRCQDEGRKSLAEGHGLIVVLAAMCQQIPRSKEEGECFETGYGLAGVLSTAALQPTIEALHTTRDKLVRFLSAVHGDCGKRSNCYWVRLMGFEREYKVYQQAEGQ